MKRILKSLCLFISLFLVTETVYAYESVIAAKEVECIILYNNAMLNFIDKYNCKLPLLEYQNNIYVPVRSFNEQIGNKVTWNESIYSKEIQINTANSDKFDKFGEFFDGDIVDVSIINLIATPEKYYGKHVRVQGVINIEFETDYLFLTSDDRKFLNEANAISLEIYNSIELEKLKTSYDELCKVSGKYCTVEGVFNELKYKSNGFLSDINLIDCNISYY